MDDLERLDELEREYEQVLTELSAPDVAGDRARFLALSRRHKELEGIVRAVKDVRSAGEDVAAAREMLDDTTADERDLAREQVALAQARLVELEQQLREQLLPKDPNDGRNVIVSIRGAEGGEEANLFAKDLYQMYLRYADARGWRVEVLDVQASDLGGIDEVTFLVKGDDAWQRLKHEAGPHRVQRVPVTESQGRVHTSSAAVTVLPEADEVEVDIDPNDLKIDVYRSTGPGGQSVNTTDSAVRITHLPTGTVVAMQDEKSQIQNRAKALRVLRSRLLKLEQDKVAEEQSRQRRDQVKGGGRADKVRTYNFKENRVTDHRVGLTLHKLDRVLQGELDELVDALVADERTGQLLDHGRGAAR
ncbi:MAG TPA: peptide chain release factor 1 [Acidimicrobiales bacterium]|nr:peptide chain release factor 1 [Acidimicrobiales bacterium]